MPPLCFWGCKNNRLIAQNRKPGPLINIPWVGDVFLRLSVNHIFDELLLAVTGVYTFSLWIIAVIFIDLHHPFRPPPTLNHYPPQHPLSLWKNCSTIHYYHSDSRLLLNWYMYFISKSNLWWIDLSSDLGITGLGMTHVSYIPSSLLLLPTHQPPPPLPPTHIMHITHLYCPPPKKIQLSTKFRP